jgi:hypothetical protein
VRDYPFPSSYNLLIKYGSGRRPKNPSHILYPMLLNAIADGISYRIHNVTSSDTMMKGLIIITTLIVKSLPTSLCQREEIGISPFGKGGLRGIL